MGNDKKIIHDLNIDGKNINSKDIENITIEVKNLPYKQSANTLFNYMEEFDFLTKIIKNKAIIPRYNEEFLTYIIDKDDPPSDIFLNKDKVPVIAFPQTCFCDINLKNVKSHTDTYGKFAIAFDKEWCQNIGVQPIHYINENSFLCNDLKLNLKNVFRMQGEDKKIIDLQNMLMENILFIKPLKGKMSRKNKVDIYNFHDEQEWRYIPNIQSNFEDLQPILFGDNVNDNTRALYTAAIEQNKNVWFNFDYKKVKYIIIPSVNFRKDIINYIFSEIDCSKDEKLELISKILVFEEIERDW